MEDKTVYHERLVQVAEGLGYKVLTLDYGSGNTKYEFICGNGHKFGRLYRNFMHNKVRSCPLCSRRKFTTEYMRNILADHGYVLMGEYINANTLMEVRCPSGHVTNIFYSNFSRGTRCKTCSDHKHSDADIDFELQKDRYIRIGEYKGIFEPLELECPVGHRITMAYNDFRKGSRCGDCYRLSLNSYDDAKIYAMSLGYEFLGDAVTSKQDLYIKCPQGHTYPSTWSRFMKGTRCTECNSSYWEQEFHAFLRGLGVEYRYNVRDVIKGEIDFLIGDLGIELHGLYFHDDKHVDKYYHRDKYIKCKEKGVNLIQLFDYEWYQKNDIVKSMLRVRMGFAERLYARDCELDVNLLRQEVADFINTNHLQGYYNHSEAYGLRYRGELVGCITISPHHRESSKLILNRLCFKRDTVVIGGVEKIFNAIPLKSGLITHSDCRFGDGEVYDKLGFVKDAVLRPDYFYLKGGKRVSKQSLKKKEEEKLIGLSEKVLRTMQGYSRVYDAGKIRWVYPSLHER